MEMISIPKDEYEKMMCGMSRLREFERLNFDLIRQFKTSLEDVKTGRLNRVA